MILKLSQYSPPYPPKGGKKHQNGTISPPPGDLGGIAGNKSKVSNLELMNVFYSQRSAVNLQQSAISNGRIHEKTEVIIKNLILFRIVYEI